MSPLSSSTLFHFTNRREHLLNILEDEFSPHYSFEDFAGVLGPGADQRNAAVAIPMVCFCDIPLSQTQAHMKAYGSYALGLTKSWGRRLGVSPVLYAYAGAATAIAVIDLHLQIEVLRGTFDDGAEFSPDTERLMCFVKPYEGRLPRPGRKSKPVRFYDEREWRYVPPAPWRALQRRDFADEKVRRLANADVRTRFRLSFEPSDIRYIVVATEDEIGPMISEVRRIKTPKYSQNDIAILSTRIVSAAQIAADF